MPLKCYILRGKNEILWQTFQFATSTKIKKRIVSEIRYICNLFSTEKKKFGNFVEEDPDLLESLGKSSKRRKSTHKNLAPIDEDDDDFSPTVKERDRKRAEKRREAAKRVRNLRL